MNTDCKVNKKGDKCIGLRFRPVPLHYVRLRLTPCRGTGLKHEASPMFSFSCDKQGGQFSSSVRGAILE